MSFSISSKRMAYFLVATSLFSTSFFFQNCSKTPVAGGETGPLNSLTPSYVSSGVEASEKIELKNENVSQIDFVISGSRVVNYNGREFSLKEDQTLRIDLATGRIQSSADANLVRCLSQELKSELSSILNSVAICKQPAASDIVCTQEVKSSYAEIRSDRDSYRLGVYSQNCAGDFVDLCDQQSELLKGFAANVKANLANLNCQ